MVTQNLNTVNSEFMDNSQPPKMTIWEQVEAEFNCDHEQTEVRSKTDAAGRVYYIRQCLGCWQKIGTAVKKASIRNWDAIQPFDDEKAAHLDKWKQARRFELQEEENRLRQSHQSAWWVKYSAYLQSPKWRKKRAAVLKRDNYLCQACLENQATQAHHLTYKHLEHEPLFDLVSVCVNCHEALHQMERETGVWS